METELISTWNLIRVSGFLSYFLLTMSVAFGLLQSFSSLKKKKPQFLFIHQNSGWIGILVSLFHMLLLFWDQYVHYPVLSILVPFSSEHETFTSGLGTISFYLFFIIIGSSDFFMKRLGRIAWKKIHLLAVPAWVLMALHGIMIGSDSSEGWAQLIYIVTISIIMILGVARGMESVAIPQHKSSHKKTQV